ncbi:hypothetical protein [Acrocarpospora sp. B8E8]|uniref:hypothetical protein n=1 Tax=Acrocarpospora sp. B8E8 TaxID=3153572 RepID=UPI00325EEFE8
MHQYVAHLDHDFLAPAEYLHIEDIPSILGHKDQIDVNRGDNVPATLVFGFRLPSAMR